MRNARRCGSAAAADAGEEDADHRGDDRDRTEREREEGERPHRADDEREVRRDRAERHEAEEERLQHEKEREGAVQPRLEGTSFPVPSTPGLGIDIDANLAQAQEWKFWEAPHWRRRDGSVQNW